MTQFKTTAAIAALIAGVAAAPAIANHHKSGDKNMKVKTEAQADMNAPLATADFADFDANGDMEVDFTEFSNYAEREYGWSAAESAKEYVRLTGENDVLTDETFASNNAHNVPHTHLTQNSRAQMDQSSTMTMEQDRTAVMGRTITTTDATLRPNYEYGVFTDYDMNNDGRVEFSEYSQYRMNSDIGTTQAAQEFMRLSDGERWFDETRYTIAVNNDVLADNEASETRTMTTKERDWKDQKSTHQRMSYDQKSMTNENEMDNADMTNDMSENEPKSW